METAQNPNERTPLLGNGPASSDHKPLYRISATVIERTPLNIATNDQRPLNENCATSKEQARPFGEGTSAMSDEKPPCTRNFEGQTIEVSLEEVVKALCSAWQRYEKRNRELTMDYFGLKELYAMHVAWKSVTRGRRCASKPHEIAEALAAAMAAFLNPVSEDREDDLSDDFYIYFAKDKDLLAANLLDHWHWITGDDDEGFPVRYIESIFEDSDEQPPAVIEYRLRQVELYDKILNFILNPKMQVLLHSLLFIWHISFVIIGSKYMDCSMGHGLSRLLMILGCLGCSATIFRLGLMLLSTGAPCPIEWLPKWMVLRLIEFTFLIVFIVQAIHYFAIDPATEPDPNQCVKSFYHVALVINCLSIPLVTIYVFVYIIRFCQYQFDIWRWVFRHL